MARFVLVHGAFSGAWVWEPLTPLLEAAGHRVQTLDLPSSGDDPTPPQEVTLDSCADRVAALLADDPEPAVVVGHSMGGMVITQAQGRAPARVAMLIYLCAFLPGNGKSLLDMTQLPEGAGDMIQANLVIEPPVGTLPLEAAREAVFAACTEEQIAWALSHHSPQALGPMAGPATYGPGFESLPKAYVVTSQDRSIPPALQRRMLREAGVTNVFEIDTDHVPQISRAAETADVLGRAVAQGMG
jgi:pimeloyl-ACP methyl ester carboxylesterase